MLRKLAGRIPGFSSWYREARRRRHRRAMAEHATSSPQEVFSYIYDRNVWNSRESASGAGSELARTEALRREFPALLQQIGTKVLLDLPCGDLNWIRKIDLPVASYIGADIVPALIERNRRRFEAASGGRMRFQVVDLIEGELPAADTILTRDCLIHLSNAHVQSALENIRASGHLEWMLLTHFPGVEENIDIATGNWRPTNLCRPPFNLPEPDFVLDEEHAEYGRFPQYLGAWRIR
jgi:Methyltransferase domain